MGRLVTEYNMDGYYLPFGCNKDGKWTMILCGKCPEGSVTALQGSFEQILRDSWRGAANVQGT